ncbi:MAG: hypothetical protein K9K67_15775, partial [Bacteriovoracaceae bacterium]|nr:hypothetical protein [Bacteriovoracaceae bacterium]
MHLKQHAMNKQLLRPTLIVVYLLIIITSLIWTEDLQQKNEENIFLTKTGRDSYHEFDEKFNVVPMVVATTQEGLKEENFLESLSNICGEECHAHSLTDLSPHKAKKEGDGYLIVASQESTKEKFKITIKKMNALVPHLSFMGIPYTNILLDEYSKTIKTYLFPILFVGIFLILSLFMGTFLEAILCFIPGLMSASLSLLATKLFFETTNLVTSIVPLLLFVIELSLVLHIHNTAKELKSLKLALKDKYEPIILMVVTTFIGFGSLSFSSLEAISQFGLLSSFLILLCTVMTIFWLSLLSTWLPEIWFFQSESKIKFNIPGSWAKCWSLKKIIVFTILSIVLGSISLPKIEIITDASRYFPSELKIKEKMDQIAEQYLGTPILEITLPLLDSSLEEFKKIEELEDSIKTKLGVSIISANTLVKLANLKYTSEEKLPPHKLSYFALKGRIPPSINEGYPLDDEYRITILFKNINVDEYETMLSSIEEIIAKSNLHASYNGLYYHLMKAQKQ